MQPKCDVVSVSPLLLALAQEELPRSLIPVRIRGMFDIVYAWLRDAPVRQAGHNYALYDRCTPQALRIQVGFPVSAWFADTVWRQRLLQRQREVESDAPYMSS